MCILSSDNAAAGVDAAPESGRADALNRLSDKDLQRLLADGIREFARRCEDDPALRALPEDAVTYLSATEVLLTVSAIMRSANLELFELGMWQAWSGSPRSA